MIPTREKNFEVKGNVQGESVKMGIDIESMPHLMNLLTDMYSDRELAVIREYTTNALDAHIEAGITRPIEVTLPSPLSQFFTVKDFGVGLSAEDIRITYTQYGKSTKRTTNDQTGMLGIGCKSALAYTNQFTVVSVKDGQQVTVLITRDEQGVGEAKLVSNVPTSEPNGTEIVVPTNTHNSFESKANRFFSYWTPGTVLVNGEEPTRFDIDAMKLSNTITVVQSPGHGAHKIVMGNIAYPWTPTDIQLKYGYSVVAQVPLGDVTPHNSRESLIDNDLTTATLTRVEKEFNESAAKSIQAEIDASPTPGEAVRCMLKWQGMFPSHLRNTAGYKYKGKVVPTGFDDLDATVAPFDPYQVTRNSKMKSLDIDNFTQSVFVTGYTLSKFTATHKKKLNQWAINEKQTSPNRREDDLTPWKSYVLLDKLPKDRAEWLLPEQVIKWEDVNAIKLPRNQPSTTNGRIPGSYDCLVGDGAGAWTTKTGKPADDIDQTHEVFYFPRSSRDAYYIRTALFTMWPNATLVCMPSTRVEKFCRLFPQAEHALEALRAGKKRWWSRLSKDTKQAMAMRFALNSYYARYEAVPAIAHLDPALVDDPDLAKCAKIAKKDLTSVVEKRKLLEEAIGRDDTDLDSIEVPDDPTVKYPLFDGEAVKRGGIEADHMYLYLNAAYAARKKED